MDVEDHLARLVPFRLDSLAVLDEVLRRRLEWGDDKEMQIIVDGTLMFVGTTLAFTNPIFEMASLHIRALLHFLGLGEKSGKLCAAGRRKDGTDSAIERIPLDGALLSMVSPDDVRATFPKEPAEAEMCLVEALRAANKGMAHLTVDYQTNRVQIIHLGAASIMTQRLVEKFVYAPLGRPRPRTPLSKA